MKKLNLEEIQSVLLDMMNDIDMFCSANNIKYCIAYGTMLGAVRHEGFIPWDDDFDIYMLPEDYIKFKKEFNKIDNKYFLQNKKTEGEYYLTFDKIRLNNSLAKDGFEDKNINHGIFIDIFPCYYIPKKLLDKFVFYIRVYSMKYINLIQVFSCSKYQDSIFGKFVRIIYLIVKNENLRNMFIKLQDKILNNCKTDQILDIEIAYNKKIMNTNYLTNLKRTKFNNLQLMSSVYFDDYLKHNYGDYMRIPEEHERYNHGADYYIG